jgi:uncharacterized membrane protein
MKTLIRVIRFVNIFCAGISAGGLVMILMALVPTMNNFEPNMSLQVHNEVDHHVDRYMRPSTATSGVSAILLLLLYLKLKRKYSAAFTALGLVGTLGVILTSEFINVPTNKMLQTWSPGQVPADYPQVRAKWDKVHVVRTSSGLLALSSYTLATLAE